MLGMEWLCTLGPLMVDFSIPKISFTHNGNDITITGDPKPTPTHSSYNNIFNLLHTDSISSIQLLLYQPVMQIESPTNPTQTEPTLHFPDSLLNSISSILKSFALIFHQPHGLPPPRPHDHHIPTLSNSTSINVKPYRYPHCKKEAMNSTISDMLQEGIIKPNNSPYSSPVLLVQKKCYLEVLR